MAQMLLKGTEDLSADEISEKIDNMGIDVSAGGGNNSFYAGFNLVSSDFDEALSLFAKIIQEPQFSPEETERMRNRLITEVGRHEGEWFYEASQFFRETFFIDHPYRRLQQGTRESLTNITREELIDFHDRFCRPDNMVIAVFGDIEALGVKEKVSSAFSDHRRVTPLNMPVNQAEPELIESKRATKYTKKEMAVIYLGYPGMTIDNLEDRYPMEVLDAVVSGVRYGRGSWLHETLRGNELVYVVHAVNWLGLDPGYFFIYAATTPEKMDQAIELILEQIDRVKREDIPDDEFELAKGMCITIEKLDHQSNYEQAFRAALDELYGLGYDHHQRHDAEIRAVTEDDVKRVANKYLNNYVLVTTIPGEDPEGGE
jgi:zinc protease